MKTSPFRKRRTEEPVGVKGPDASQLTPHISFACKSYSDAKNTPNGICFIKINYNEMKTI